MATSWVTTHVLVSLRILQYTQELEYLLILETGVVHIHVPVVEIFLEIISVTMQGTVSLHIPVLVLGLVTLPIVVPETLHIPVIV